MEVWLPCKETNEIFRQFISRTTHRNDLIIGKKIKLTNLETTQIFKANGPLKGKNFNKNLPFRRI